MGYAGERAAAIHAVEQACRLTRTVQEHLVAGTTLQKGDKSPVTVADYGAQAIVGRLLARAFPQIPMVGEEDAALLRDPAHAGLTRKVVDAVRTVMDALEGRAVEEAEVLAAIDAGVHEGGRTGRHWTLDPIDGTKGFLRLEQYAVALALVEEGQVVLGVLGCPNLPWDPAVPNGPRGTLFIAERGQGAVRQPLHGGTALRCTVDPIADPSRARMTESVESGHTDQSESAQVLALLGTKAEAVRMDSQAKYGVVARGEASVYLRLPTRADYVEKIWDHAAGSLVVEEAGGKVTDVHGKKLDFGLGRGLSSTSGVVVTNSALHDRVLDAVRQVLKLS
jgi:3'(2'), 5'-bisphosphate nucleotidase